MSELAVAQTDVGQFDPGLTRLIVDLTRPITKRYFRAEVRGLDNIPNGPCLVVGNHSGGIITPDMSVFAVAYYDECGYDRPLYTLAHDMALRSPAAGLMKPHRGDPRDARKRRCSAGDRRGRNGVPRRRARAVPADRQP